MGAFAAESLVQTDSASPERAEYGSALDGPAQRSSNTTGIVIEEMAVPVERDSGSRVSQQSVFDLDVSATLIASDVVRAQQPSLTSVPVLTKHASSAVCVASRWRDRPPRPSLMCTNLLSASRLLLAMVLPIEVDLSIRFVVTASGIPY